MSGRSGGGGSSSTAQARLCVVVVYYFVPILSTTAPAPRHAVLLPFRVDLTVVGRGTLESTPLQACRHDADLFYDLRSIFSHDDHLPLSIVYSLME